MLLKSNRSFLVVFAIAMLAFFLTGLGSNAAEAQTTRETTRVSLTIGSNSSEAQTTSVIHQTKKAKKDRKNCSRLKNTEARKNCQQNKNGNGNGNGIR